MAIWQFKVFVIPESALIKKFGMIPISVPKDLADNFDWWDECQPSESIEAAIGSMLPEAESWARSIRIWGDERSDSAVVCYRDDSKKIVEEIEFRFDVRSISLPFIRRVVAFAKRLQSVFVPRSYQVVAADESMLLAKISKSTAKKYVDDPVSTLRSLKLSQAEIACFPLADDSSLDE